MNRTKQNPSPPESANSNGQAPDAPDVVGLTEPLVASIHRYLQSRPYGEVAPLATALDGELKAIIQERDSED